MPSSEARLLDLPAYLEALGLPAYAPLHQPAPCDLCGHTQAVSLRDTVRVTADLRARFETLCCAQCGLLFQSPRFAPGFYDAYYAQVYRLMVGGGSQPSAAYIADQSERGAALIASLARWLPTRGRLLDVGCGAGGMMQPFIARGWSALGVDPDAAAVADAVARGLPVVAGSAETMELAPEHYDLIVITGSLEHVQDPHRVLALCHAAAAPDGLILLEAHGLGQAAHLGAIGHNHRRLLTGTSLTLFLLEHGWAVEWVTDQPLCGPTRPGSTFALGRRATLPPPGALHNAIAGGVRDTPVAMATLLDTLGIR